MLTTPNREYNSKWETLPPGRMRHADHRFEWTRQEFQSWAGRVGERFGYSVRFMSVGPDAQFSEPRSAFHPFRFGTTPYLEKIRDRQKETMAGPVFLQDHGNPVQFRNVWVVPADDLAFEYQPGGK